MVVETAAIIRIMYIVTTNIVLFINPNTFNYRLKYLNMKNPNCINRKRHSVIIVSFINTKKKKYSENEIYLIYIVFVAGINVFKLNSFREIWFHHKMPAACACLNMIRNTS